MCQKIKHWTYFYMTVSNDNPTNQDFQNQDIRSGDQNSKKGLQFPYRFIIMCGSFSYSPKLYCKCLFVE